MLYILQTILDSNAVEFSFTCYRFVFIDKRAKPFDAYHTMPMRHKRVETFISLSYGLYILFLVSSLLPFLALSQQFRLSCGFQSHFCVFPFCFQNQGQRI